MAQEQPSEFNMRDLFIDVKLEACVGGTTFDFLGRKLFSTEFFREGVGFGITNIDIEINTSLQPLVTIIFKDLYGLTVFGGQNRNSDNDNQSHDYSVIFNWPPPKFLFSFKGYLGKPASWVLNLKRTSTSFNSSDGSYEVKCEFVPNQWGFFADLPFLYLLAVKRLRKDKVGPLASQEQLRNVTSIFDLIKIGKQVEIKTSDTTKEFDDLVNQLGSLKSNIARAITATNILSEGQEIKGLVNNQLVRGFQNIEIPRLEVLDANINTKEKIELKLGNPRELSTLNTYLLLSLKFSGQDSFSNGILRNYEIFSKRLSEPGGDDIINSAKISVLNKISANLQKVDDEIKRRVFSTSETKLEKITIGEIFSQLAKDSAYVMGSILDAGLDGYRGSSERQKLRNQFIDNGRLIGESFPLVLIRDGEEVPATKNNLGTDIGVDEHEMQFVKNFISAISEGIANELLVNNEQFGQDDGILKQRINNIEMSSSNPYKSYYTNIATNVLVRAGIAAYMTRSNDPNLPGDYTNVTFDRDDIQSIQELAERDMQNLTESIIQNLSDVDFLLLKRFATFFSRYFTSDCRAIANCKGESGISFPGPFDFGGNLIANGISGINGVNVLNWKVVMSNQNQEIDGKSLEFINGFSKSQLEPYVKNGLEYLTFQQVWNELTNQSLLTNLNVVGDRIEGFTDIEDAESRREDQNLIDELTTSSSLFNTAIDIASEGTRNAQNPLSFVNTTDFTATRIVNNGIAYMYPSRLLKYIGGAPFESSLQKNVYMSVLFQGEDHKRALEANTAPSDSEFKNSDKDTTDAGQNEPTGYISLNAKYGEKGNDAEVQIGDKYLLNRVGTLIGYRDGTQTSFGDNVFDFEKCKNPGPSFYIGGDVQLKWRKSFVSDITESINSESPEGFTEAGQVGFTVCAHIGSEVDSSLVFGLFNITYGGRNQRAYIKKCAEVILQKIKGIEDKRNQIIGEVLGKAGDQEGSIYKQMHTLFHQWQTLSYKDMLDSRGSLCGDVDENKSGEGGDTGRVFNVATSLERRFGDNHKDLQINEMLCFSKEELLEGVSLTQEELQSLTEISSGPNAGKICLNLANQNHSASIPDGTFIYDYPMQRISAPEDPIDVRDSIINLEPLYNPNANTTILNIIQQICTKNNFLFIPIPGNPGYLNVKDIYSPSREPANIVIRNFFHVLFTPTPESRTKTRNTNGTALADYTNEQRKYDVNSFVIKYGHPDNQIVSNIQVGTDDNKVTAESIVNLQRLVDNENQNKKVTTDCSMLPVLAGRSYKASVDMLGNSQCYPMQFFFLENSPLFGGLYQVMKVKHTIEPNNMKTSMEGIRMRFSPGGDGYGSIKPITLKTFRNLGESEAPLALGQGFDEIDRKALSDFASGLGSTFSNFKANLADYSGSEFVNGSRGGPVALPVSVLSINELNTYDTSLGARDLWSGGKIMGSAQMYIIDGYPLTAQVLSAYKAMRTAAFNDGVKLALASGYRDPFNNIIAPGGRFISTSQYELRKQNIKNNSKKNDDNWIRTAPSSEFNPATARPGYSNHNSGLAIDLNCKGAKFGGVVFPIYEWLVLNAYKYGFVRTVASEEWHWEYLPGKAMFQFDGRDGSKWYGLPDKLGIPFNKPAGVEPIVSSGVANLQNTLNSEQKRVVDKIIKFANQAGIKDKNRLFGILVVARKESNFGIKNESFDYDLTRAKQIFGNRISELGKTDIVMNQNYIPADRVPVNTSPKYGSEKKLADLIYGNRYGNGPTEGYLYRGRGMSQITFKSNYVKMNSNLKKYFNLSIDIVKNPELVATEDVAIQTLIAGKLGQQFGAFNNNLDFLNNAEAIHKSNHGTNPYKSINQATFEHTKKSYEQLKNDSYIFEKLKEFPDYA